MRSGLHAGSTIADRYTVGELLGRGGMGEVRAGRDLRLDRDVAIKLLSPELAARRTTRERFEGEARAAARLNHPNIVVVYDSGEHDGVPFLVMERLPGRTLEDELAGGALPVERVRRLGVDVLTALAASHRAGIVHRDVKPGNVLLSGSGAVKVADFGIAKSADDVDLTGTGNLVGTPAYLSPEQLAGEPASPASDIYSVGVLLYEAVSATKPFTGETAFSIAQAVQAGRPVPLAGLRPDAPAALVAVIERAMEKDPARRFASAEEMVAALSATTQHSVRSTSSPTTRLSSATDEFGAPGRLRMRVGGQRRLVLVLAGVFAAVLVLAVLLAGADNAADPPGVTPTTATAPQPSELPAELDRALERLEEAVRP